MIEILVDDPWFLVINKPVDLLTQAIAGIPNVQSRLIEQLATTMTSTPFIGIPHRLDRMTSGAVVVARNQRSLSLLCAQFASRKVTKDYLAWVQGDIESQGDWIDWMRKIPDVPQAELVSQDAEGAREARLSFRKLAMTSEPPVHTSAALNASTPITASTPISLVLIRLETGRMHQIRLQFSSRGHPILGDSHYGSSQPWGAPDRETREQPIALHAARLQFFHPKTGEKMTVHAPPPVEYPWGITVKIKSNFLETRE
ncbi:MAG: RluA family pseudouridine synthase [Planctomycetes bacterium]|nr:RluA family pseudouridine synthase [Planctomycetota bacterium]